MGFCVVSSGDQTAAECEQHEVGWGGLWESVDLSFGAGGGGGFGRTFGLSEIWVSKHASVLLWAM